MLVLPGTDLTSTELLRSVEAEEGFPCLDYGGTIGERRSRVHPVPSKTHFDAPSQVCTYLRHFSLNMRDR